MVLKSKSFIWLTILTLFGLLFIVYWIVIFFDSIFFEKDISSESLIILPVLLIPCIILYTFFENLNAFEFTKESVIIYKLHFIKFKSIDWKDLDYSFNTIESNKNGYFEVIYLVKNKKLILKISESNFKNYKEIKNFISIQIQNKGFIDLGFFNSIKYLTKGKINKLP